MPIPPGRPERPPFEDKGRRSQTGPDARPGSAAPNDRETRGQGGDGFAPRRPKSFREELRFLDEKIIRTLRERTLLLAEAGDPPVEAEREMRAFWDDAAHRHRLHPGALRQILALAGSMAQDARRRSTDKVMPLPLQPAGDGPALLLDTHGPSSGLHVRLWTALAAVAGSKLTLGPVLLSDPIVEFIKALNQAGASLNWEGELVTGRSDAEPLAFEGAKIFAGHDPLNCYLLLALALGQPGTCRISGGVGLKLLDLTALNEPIFNPLGARVMAITPSSRGVPARLEAGGPMADTLELPADCPPELAMALTLAACTYRSEDSDQLTLIHNDHASLKRAVSVAAEILTAAGVDVVATEDRVTIPFTTPAVPPLPSLPLDPMLSLGLLALPRMVGVPEGQVQLAGGLEDSALTASGSALLEAVRLKVDRNAESVSSQVLPPAGEPQMVRLDCPHAELVPLAAALGAAAPAGALLRLSGESLPMAEEAERVLSRMGKSVFVETRADDTIVSIDPGCNATPGSAVNAPSPAWAVAVSLYNFSLGDSLGGDRALALTNPGVMTEVWPGYWSLIARLAQEDRQTLTTLTRPPEDDNGPEPVRKRRIRIG